MEETSNKTVSVIIVTRGLNNYLNSCLDSLKKQTHPQIEIVVIGNALKDDFTRGILNDYPRVKLITNPANLFYCGALNKGIESSRGAFLLCLNDDVILDGYFIEKAVKGFFVDSRIGMVSGKILRQDAKTLDSTGLFLSPWRSVKERGYGTRDNGQFQDEGYIFGANGAVAFYRRKMLEQIKEKGNYFDPDFHIFYEDLDISWRAQRLGWKGYYVPEAVAYHLRGGTVRTSGGVDKPYARRYLQDNLHADLIKNRYAAIIKNESVPDFLLHLPCIFLYDLIMWTYILFFKPQQIRMFISNLRYLKSALAKRDSPKRT
ncbi:MAG: glycosyltransferase family 2 protein [Deltaproteobacteria bacterium]